MMDFLYPLTTMSFAYPWLLLAPISVGFCMFIRHRRSAAALCPAVGALAQAPGRIRIVLRRFSLGLLGLVTVIMLSLAAARPQRITIADQLNNGRNLVLALDVSPSMSATDFRSGGRRMTRLSAVQQVVTDFIDARPFDRMGLVVFGGRAYLQSPLTRDRSVLKNLVGRLEVGMAGDGTAIGDGLGQSMKRIEEMRKSAGQADIPAAIILLTDGVSNAGQVNPIKAAKVAGDLGIKIYSIGIGSKEPVTVSLPGGIFTQQVQAQAEFDEETLREMADLTKGKYFNAMSLEDLSKVYREIDKLETSAQDEPGAPIVEELFWNYALIALSAYALYVALTWTVFLRVP